MRLDDGVFTRGNETWEMEFYRRGEMTGRKKREGGREGGTTG